MCVCVYVNIRMNKMCFYYLYLEEEETQPITTTHFIYLLISSKSSNNQIHLIRKCRGPERSCIVNYLGFCIIKINNNLNNYLKIQVGVQKYDKPPLPSNRSEKDDSCVHARYLANNNAIARP